MIDCLTGRETQKPVAGIGDEVLLGEFVPFLAAAAEDTDQTLRNDRVASINLSCMRNSAIAELWHWGRLQIRRYIGDAL